jgi:hypothetical protein
MAPEVICKSNHTEEVDYFALGVIGYEFMTGKVNVDRFSDRMLEPIGKRSDRRFWRSKSNWMKYLLLGGAEIV